MVVNVKAIKIDGLTENEPVSLMPIILYKKESIDFIYILA
jgi:hypothetical protein